MYRSAHDLPVVFLCSRYVVRRNLQRNPRIRREIIGQACGPPFAPKTVPPVRFWACSAQTRVRHHTILKAHAAHCPCVSPRSWLLLRVAARTRKCSKARCRTTHLKTCEIEDPAMPVTFDADEFDSALRQFRQPKSVSAPISSSVASPSAAQRSQSEEFKVRIITSRAKLKLMRDRSDALRDSLQRFRMQQHGANRA